MSSGKTSLPLTLFCGSCIENVEVLDNIIKKTSHCMPWQHFCQVYKCPWILPTRLYNHRSQQLSQMYLELLMRLQLVKGN